mgnify:CR=1 FL=1
MSISTPSRTSIGSRSLTSSYLTSLDIPIPGRRKRLASVIEPLIEPLFSCSKEGELIKEGSYINGEKMN